MHMLYLSYAFSLEILCNKEDLTTKCVIILYYQREKSRICHTQEVIINIIYFILLF